MIITLKSVTFISENFQYGTYLRTTTTTTNKQTNKTKRIDIHGEFALQRPIKHTV
jgi:hypothetical protein